MTGCAGGNAEKEREDSIRNADSLTAVEAAIKTTEQTWEDSIRQDSIAKADASLQASTQYDDIINKYEDAADAFYKYVRTSNYDDEKAIKLNEKCWKLSKQIKKIKNELTPEQLSKVKAAEKKIDNSVGFIAG